MRSSADTICVRARTLYPGGAAAPLHDHEVSIEDGKVVRISPMTDTDRDAEIFDIVAPGFVDLQINGGGGVLFNDAPSVASIERIAQAARTGGTTHLLPTFITAPGRAYADALQAVSNAIAAGVPGILGTHLEGPFLAPGRPGIHPASAIRPLTAEDCDVLCAFPHPLMLTLAPECQDVSLIARLSEAGVRVFAGHTEATSEEIQAAADAGLVGLTHLWNAMSQPSGRAPGAVGAALGDGVFSTSATVDGDQTAEGDRTAAILPGGAAGSHKDDRDRPRRAARDGRSLARRSLMAGIIADGVHVHPLNLATTARAMAGRLFLVTDAMPTLGAPDTAFEIGGVPIRCDGQRLVSPQGTLAGAQLSMDQAVRTMVQLAGVAVETALDMASGRPAAALGLSDRFGMIGIGREAHLTCLDARLTAQRTMIDGVWS